MNNARNLPVLRGQTTASFCDICPDPGHCCRRFYLHKSFWVDEGLEDAQRIMTEFYPFKIEGWAPNIAKDASGREYADVICSCPKVTPEGRCSIYDTRPITCRKFVPGSDKLCVFVGMNGVSFDESNRG